MPETTTKLAETVSVRPAASRAELEDSFRLVYRSYLQRGYVVPSPTEIRLGLHNILPAAATFVGIIEDTVIATVSLVPDSPMGLPMDGIYHDEADELRQQGRRLTEVTMLADRRMEIKRTLPMLLSLMKLVFDYAQLVLKANDLCITINPRHAAFYERYLLFEDLGPERSYDTVQGHPALAKRLNLDTVREACRDHGLLLRIFFEDRTPIHVFQSRYAMSCEDVEYFYVKLTSTLRHAEAEHVNFLRTQRPDCAWDRWLS